MDYIAKVTLPCSREMAKVMSGQNNVRPSPESLAASISATKSRGSPPVHLWNPPFCGNLDMRIARDGTWYYEGTPIGRPGLVKLFASILKKEEGSFFLVTPVEKVGITVDDAPFVAVDFDAEGDGAHQMLNFTTNVGDVAVAGAACPIQVVRDAQTGEPSPYVLIRADLEALIDRKSFYRLVDLGVHHDGWFGVWSDEVFFRIIPSAELP